MSRAVDHLVNNAGISRKSVGVEDWLDVSEFTPIMVSHETEQLLYLNNLVHYLLVVDLGIFLKS